MEIEIDRTVIAVFTIQHDADFFDTLFVTSSSDGRFQVYLESYDQRSTRHLASWPNAGDAVAFALQQAGWEAAVRAVFDENDETASS